MKAFFIIILILFSPVVCAEDLTYGSFKKNLTEGETTQRDVISLYGSPDNMVMDREGELWVYDKISTVTTSTNNRDIKSTNKSSYGTLGIIGGASTEERVNSEGGSSTERTTKTFFAILEFNNDGILTKISVRTSKY